MRLLAMLAKGIDFSPNLRHKYKVVYLKVTLLHSTAHSINYHPPAQGLPHQTRNKTQLTYPVGNKLSFVKKLYYFLHNFHVV